MRSVEWSVRRSPTVIPPQPSPTLPDGGERRVGGGQIETEQARSRCEWPSRSDAWPSLSPPRRGSRGFREAVASVPARGSLTRGSVVRPALPTSVSGGGDFARRGRGASRAGAGGGAARGSWPTVGGARQGGRARWRGRLRANAALACWGEHRAARYEPSLCRSSAKPERNTRSWCAARRLGLDETAA